MGCTLIRIQLHSCGYESNPVRMTRSCVQNVVELRWISKSGCRCAVQSQFRQTSNRFVFAFGNVSPLHSLSWPSNWSQETGTPAALTQENNRNPADHFRHSGTFTYRVQNAYNTFAYKWLPAPKPNKSPRSSLCWICYLHRSTK